MIVKSWKFKGYDKADNFPSWVQQNTSKRANSDLIWVHTQEGEMSAKEGEWIAIDIKGHLTIYEEKPDSLGKDIIAGIAFAIISAVTIITFLAW
tara:strand:- start:428 stop:709 length:282 start_codon:yes stop_codon:yes gene_type:complete